MREIPRPARYPIAVVLGAGVALVIVFSQRGHADVLWLVWGSLALALCIGDGALVAYGFERQAELRSLLGKVESIAWVPAFALVVVGLLCVNSFVLLEGFRKTNLANGLLLSISTVAAAPLAAALFTLRRLLRDRPHADSGFGAEFHTLIRVHRLAQRILTVSGGITALITVQAGMLLALERNLHTEFGQRPPQYILLVGAFGSLYVAAGYIPARMELRAAAGRLIDNMLGFADHNDPREIIDIAEARQKAEQHLGIDRSMLTDLQANLLLLSPLLVSAFASILPR